MVGVPLVKQKFVSGDGGVWWSCGVYDLLTVDSF